MALSLALILLAFLCGSLPFSVWLGRIFCRTDVRRYGDGNPGATNAFRAGGALPGLQRAHHGHDGYTATGALIAGSGS